MQETVYFGVGANSPSPLCPSSCGGRGGEASLQPGVVVTLGWWGPWNGGDPGMVGTLQFKFTGEPHVVTLCLQQQQRT